MAQSLVSLVMEALGPSVIDRLAGTYGESRDGARKGLTAAVPALLSGLAGLAGRPGGADRLATAAQQQDPSILDNLSGVIGGTGQGTLSESGRSVLTSLLGSQALDGLTGAIAKFAGIGQGSTSGLLGLLAPVVMAVLRRQQSSMGLDAQGLGRMLTDQKGAIAGAIPPGLSNLLAGAGIRDSAAETIGQTAAKLAPTSGAKPGLPAWVYALGGIIILGLLGYWLWGGQAPQQAARLPTDRTASGTSQAPSAPGSVMVGQVDVGKQLKSTVDGATKALSGVTDADSAKTALPQLNEAIAQLDKVKGLSDQVPADGKKALTGIVGTAKPALLQLIDKVEAVPGVADVLKPTLDALKARLDSITTEI